MDTLANNATFAGGSTSDSTSGSAYPATGSSNDTSSPSTGQSTGFSPSSTHSTAASTSLLVPSAAVTVSVPAAGTVYLSGTSAINSASMAPVSSASFDPFPGVLTSTASSTLPVVPSSSAPPAVSETPSATVTIRATTTLYTTLPIDVTVTSPSASQGQPTVTEPADTITVRPIGPVPEESLASSSPSSPDLASGSTTAVGTMVGRQSLSIVTVYVTASRPAPTTTTVTVVESTSTICSGKNCAVTTSSSGSSPVLSNTASTNLNNSPRTTYSYSRFWQSYSSYMAANPNTPVGGSRAAISATTPGAQSSVAAQATTQANTSTATNGSAPSISKNTSPGPPSASRSSLPPGVFVFPDTDMIGYSWSVITLSNSHLTQTRLGPITTTCIPTATATTVGRDGKTTFSPQCKSGPGPMVVPGLTSTSLASTTSPYQAGSSTSGTTSTANRRRDNGIDSSVAMHTTEPGRGNSRPGQVEGWMARLSRFFVLPFKPGVPNATTLATVVRSIPTTTSVTKAHRPS